MRIYGLTGGIASGKSEAARRFLAQGIPVIDADRIGHRVIEPGGIAEARVVEAFGSDILTDGAIDRHKLGARVFGDPKELERLNAIVQPAIKDEIWKQCAALAREGQDLVIIDAALLAEGGKIADRVDGLILVIAPQAVRVERLVGNRGLTPEQALKRIEAQTPPESKIPLADWVVENTGSLSEFQAKIDDLAYDLQTRLPRSKRAAKS